jgi:Fur family ferric uptake transcriptional regulator
MTATDRHPLIETFVSRLEEQGHRVTGSRRTVARAVARQGGHFTIEGLTGQMPGVGRATVYRNIKLMVEMGLVCRVLLEDGQLHYQVSHKGHHHHLICTGCGASQDLLGCDIEEMLRDRAAGHQFAMEGHWLDVYGRCRGCRESAAA